jgi:hypothetical protein
MIYYIYQLSKFKNPFKIYKNNIFTCKIKYFLYIKFIITHIFKILNLLKLILYKQIRINIKIHVINKIIIIDENKFLF